MQWFRMYSEAVDDDKLRLLAFEDRWHFVALLCLKAGGVLDSDAQTLERRIAIKLGLMPPDLAEVKRRLREVGLIGEDWQPSSWGKRQFESDHTGALRSRRWRKKTKRHGDVTETSQQHHGDGPEQNRTDTEKSKRGSGGERSLRSRRAPPEFQPDLEYARGRIPDLDADREVQKFRDWEFKTPRSDWPAVWRTWIGNCCETGKYARAASSPDPAKYATSDGRPPLWR